MIIHKNIEFKNYNTLHINNLVKYMFEVENSFDIYILIYLFNYFKIDYYVIGNGSKILFKDEIITKPIILINSKFHELYFFKDNILVSSGTKLSHLIVKSANKNCGGFHNLFPIPATIGGCVYMNAGDSKNSISKYIEKVICLDKQANLIIFNNKQCNFSYRNSIFMSNNYIILFVLLKYELIDKNIIFKEIKDAITYRKTKQEVGKYTCGSLFKNSNGYKAYELINKIDKSVNINGAHLSSIHSNFLINDNNATNEDVLKLINNIQEQVKDKTGKYLQLELNVL